MGTPWQARHVPTLHAKNGQLEIHCDKALNPLAPSDPYMGRTAQLTSRRCILNTYSTNTHTEYFKRAA
jgi:hypothetical protein